MGEWPSGYCEFAEPARFARTRFKPSLVIRFPRFGHSKTASFGQLSTPLDVDDTDEQVRGTKRSKVSAVLAVRRGKTRRIESWSVVVERRFLPSVTWYQPEVFAEELNAAMNQNCSQLDEKRPRAAGCEDDWWGFLTPVNSENQG